jgi:hypothetical protein
MLCLHSNYNANGHAAAQVLPRLGCVVPEDAALLPPPHLAGSLLTRLFLAAPGRAAWLAAEAAGARAAVRDVALDEPAWLAPPLAGGGGGSTDVDVVNGGGGGGAPARGEAPSAASEAICAALDGLFARCMWLGATAARAVMVEAVLGAALDVRTASLSRDARARAWQVDVR